MIYPNRWIIYLNNIFTVLQNQTGDEDDETDLKYFIVETSPGVYEVEDLVNAEIDTMSKEDDMTYHFFTQKDPYVGVDVKSSNIDLLNDAGFTPSLDILFIIHGWKGDNYSSLNEHVKEAILTNHNINLFVVDWSPIARKNYISAKGSVVKVGEYVANFIRVLSKRYNLSPSQITFVGFSLGAHVAGNAGAALNGQVDHIVGLDPAGPLFSSKRINERLDPTDANFVHVIHTNGGLLGYKKACGHADYYPNGGSSQPGCGLDLFGGCSHSRAYSFYSEAILAGSNQFVAQRCSSYKNYKKGRCGDDSKSVLGGYSVDAG